MVRIGRSRTALVGACLVLCILALAGCREEEQDRVLFHDPGTYPLELPDPAGLDEGTVRSLNERALTQRF